MSRLLCTLSAIAACCTIVAGCDSGPTKSEPRLVLLYATCSLSRLHLSPYDPTRSFTPEIERFAQESAVFTRHHTESGQSGVAYASLFSGTDAGTHGVYYHPNELSSELDLIAERFARHGYETHSWLDHGMASAELGYADGVPYENRHEGMLLAESPEFLQLLEELNSDPEKRAFVVTNFTRSHAPYRGQQIKRLCESHPQRCRGVYARPNEFKRLRRLYFQHHIDLSWDFERSVRRMKLSAASRRNLEELVGLLYDGDVANVDSLFGAVVDQIDGNGLRNESIVAFTSDHGEIGIRDNAPFRWTHGMQLAPEVLHVPLIIRAPGVGVASGSIADVSRAIDVAPTLAGLAGLAESSPTAEGSGVDLSAPLQGRADFPKLTAVSHTAMLPPSFRKQRLRRYPTLAKRFPDLDPANSWIAARDGDQFYELRFDPPRTEPSPHLYDLGRDPDKRDDRFDATNPRHAEMLATLKRERQRLIDGFRTEPAEDPEQRARDEELMRSLGYIE